MALAALALGRDGAFMNGVDAMPRRRALLAMPLVLFAAYVVAGALVRLAFLYEIRPNVRLAAGLAIALLVSAGQVAQFVQWAAGRSYKNYQASLELGRRLPAGTMVHGKLANGLALENRIRPIFVGRGFGNYEDRKTRDDVRYILTYVAPSLGYESQAHNPIIRDVIDAYPDQRIIMTFDVAETATGHDRAALIDKFGGRERQTGQMGGRAKD